MLPNLNWERLTEGGNRGEKGGEKKKEEHRELLLRDEDERGYTGASLITSIVRLKGKK